MFSWGIERENRGMKSVVKFFILYRVEDKGIKPVISKRLLPQNRIN